MPRNTDRHRPESPFTLTCSYRPIFICLVSVTAFPVALEALICSLLFSRCSAKDYGLSLILTSGISIYFRVANHPVEFPTKFNQHKRGTDPTRCPQLPSDPSSDRNCGFDVAKSLVKCRLPPRQ